MPSKARKKKIMEKLNRAQNAQFWGFKPRVKGGPPGSAPESIADYPISRSICLWFQSRVF